MQIHYPQGLTRDAAAAKLAAATLLTLLALGTSARAQVQSNLPGAGFDVPANPVDAATQTIHVYSRETVLDVLATDADGKPVRGLKRSDFTILEDNLRQPIRSFAEYDKNSPQKAPAALPPGTYTNAHALPANGPVQIFYFDIPCAASYPPGSDPAADAVVGGTYLRAKPYIADYFRTMPAGTQVAVFAYRCDYGLRLLQGFTTDGQKAAAAIDNLVVMSVGKSPSFDPIAAADQIADYVAGIHGRKNLIWIGGPLNIMRDGGQSWDRSPDMVYVHRLMDTYDRFTREQIAIDPFDPKGVQQHDLGFDSLRVEDVATETGGEAIYNTNDFKSAAARIVDDTSHYYTLSYVPTRPDQDGHFHPIKITVNRPGVHLVYRGGYNDEQPPPPDDVLKVHMTQASMGLGALPSTQLVFNLQAQPTPPATDAANQAKLVSARRPLPASKTEVSYDLLYNLDPTQFSFTQAADHIRRSSIEFDAAAYDPDGKLAAIRSQTLTLTLTPEEYLDFVQTPFRFYLNIPLPPGQFTLRAGVFEGTSGRAGTLEIPLTIPKPPKEE